MRVATAAQGAEFLQAYVEAGFGGFTLNNPTFPTVESIGLGGELIKLMRGSNVGAGRGKG